MKDYTIDLKTLIYNMQEAIVHPLVLLSILDHHNRIDADRVIGVLLGSTDTTPTSSKTLISTHITNSFAVPFEEHSSGNWFVDTSYLQNMHALVRKINSRERIVGWYHSGGVLTPSDQEIMACFARYCEDPLLVVVDMEIDELPVKVYKMVEVNGKKVLSSVSARIETEEAEEVGVEHLIREIKDETDGYMRDKVKEIKESLRIYERNIDCIVKYIEDVRNSELKCNHEIMFELQECMNDLPCVEPLKVESLNGVYLSCLAKNVVKLRDLVKNRKENEAINIE